MKNLYKKFLLTFLALNLMSLGLVSAKFSDVSEDYVFTPAIDFLTEQQVVSGYPDGTFRPTNSVNRVEFLKMLLGSKFSETELKACDLKILKFSDLEAGAWYLPYICVGVRENWVGGYPDGTFRPANQINFVEGAKILSGGLKSSGVWYQDAVNYLADRAAIPVEVKSFDQVLDRGLAAELMFRLMQPDLERFSRSYEELSDTNLLRKNLVETLQDLSDAKIFWSAVDQLNFDKKFAQGEWTLFVPDDAAFKKLQAGVLEDLLKVENAAELEYLIGEHVFSGKFAFVDLHDGLEITDLNGDKHVVKLDGNKVFLDGAEILFRDIESSDGGVVHVVDSLLIPKF